MRQLGYDRQSPSHLGSEMIGPIAERHATAHVRRIEGGGHVGMDRERWKDRMNWYSATVGRYPEWVQNTILVVLLSTAFGLFTGIADFVHGSGDIAGLLNKFLSAWIWAPMVPLILVIDRRLPLTEKQFPLRLMVHFVLSVPWAAAHTAVLAIAELPFKIIPFSPLLQPQYAYYYFLGDWFSYWAIFALVFAIRYYRRYNQGQLEFERLNNRFLQIHLDYLRMQLEPHFLSNALNAIASTTETDPPLARRIIADLGALLRLSHEYKDRQLIPLNEEIAVLQHYLSIQRVRFGERIRIEIDIAPNVENAYVPCLLLQPLAENAIRHGLMGTSAGGTITISGKRCGDTVEIELADDGAGLPPGWKIENSVGQGLAITRERLAALFPHQAARFTMEPREGGGTVARVVIPMLSSGARL